MLLRFPFPVDMVDAKHPPRRKAAGSARSSSSWGVAAFLVSLVFLLGVLASGALAFGDGDASTVQVQALNLRGSFSSQLHFGNAFERRRLLQTQPSSNSRLLAVRGDRRDPLDSFRKYRGGYDVQNKHYWASAIYTGVYGFAIGVAWLLLGALLTLLACFKLCCCRREKTAEPRSSFYYWLPRILVLLLSLFAIGCIITLFVRNKQFHTQAFRVRDTISSAADDASGAVRNVSSTLSRVDTLVRQYNIAGMNQIGSTVTNLNQQADRITNEVNSNTRTYNRLVNGIEIALIVILAVALFLVILGIIAAVAGWRTIFFLVILLGWLLTALVWILFGLFFAVNNITSDTCQAFGEYLQAPANTTLDDLLPCVDANTASSASSVARQGVDNIILQANNAVTQIRQGSAQVGRTAELPNVCDPIGPAPTYTYTSQCPAGTVPIGQLPQVVQPYVCTVEPLSNECLAAGRVVTPTQSRTIGDLSESGQSLLNIIPTVTSLTNCSFVYNTFNALVTERCSPAKQSLRNMWIPLLLLSIAMTLLSLAWILANHRNKKQRYSRTIHSQESPRGYK